MAKRLVFNCDKCGVEINDGKATLDLAEVMGESKGQNDSGKWPYDLCPPCQLLLLGFLKVERKV
jgi:hypothetical protein